MVQLVLLVLTLQSLFLIVFSDRVRLEKFEHESNLAYVKQNVSIDANGFINLDLELSKTLQNAKAYLGAVYGTGYKNVAFNRSVNLNKALTFVGVTPLAIAIMSLIKTHVDVPLQLPVQKVRRIRITWIYDKHFFH